MAPTWFILIFGLFMILYVLYNVLIHAPRKNTIDLIKGESSALGCLIKTFIGFIVGGILIWYIIGELL